MLAYLLRTLPVVLRAVASRQTSNVSRLHRRVRPREVDVNLHMNQAAYAQVMELGRADWSLRSGALKHCRAQGVWPVVAEQRITYRRELKPLQAYVLDTRAVAVEGRLLLCETYLLVGDRAHARGQVWLIFVGPQGVLTPEQVQALCAGWLTDPLPIEDWRVA